MSVINEKKVHSDEHVETIKTVNDALSVFAKNTNEYERLAAAAASIQAFTGCKCKVDTVYFDHSQNWLYATILMESGLETFAYYQVLSPKQQLNIVYGSPEAWFEAVKEVVNKTLG